jgi:hypothetical protein
MMSLQITGAECKHLLCRVVRGTPAYGLLVARRPTQSISALIHVLAHQGKRASPEREDKQRCTPIEKLDLELPIRDRCRLAN